MKKKEIKFRYIEEFKKERLNISEEELKDIFNKKYFLYIKRKERRF